MMTCTHTHTLKNAKDGSLNWCGCYVNGIYKNHIQLDGLVGCYMLELIMWFLYLIAVICYSLLFSDSKNRPPFSLHHLLLHPPPSPASSSQHMPYITVHTSALIKLSLVVSDDARWAWLFSPPQRITLLIQHTNTTPSHTNSKKNLLSFRTRFLHFKLTSVFCLSKDLSRTLKSLLVRRKSF